MTAREEAQAALAKFDDALRHGPDLDHCGACYGSCGAWAGELVGEVQPHADALAAALRALLAEASQTLTATEIEADRNAAEARAEANHPNGGHDGSL